MKKIFFMALMAVMSISASAQIEQGLRFGVRASVALTLSEKTVQKQQLLMEPVLLPSTISRRISILVLD